MADLIDRQILMKKFSDLVGASNNSDFVRTPTWNDAVSLVESIPSAQQEIIRCKDCKFYSPMNRETKTGICNLTMHQNFGDNWFCAGAERKTMSDLISAQGAITKIVDTAIQNILSDEQKLTKDYEQSVKEAANIILNIARRTNG